MNDEERARKAIERVNEAFSKENVVEEHDELPGGMVATDDTKVTKEEPVDSGRAEVEKLPYRLDELTTDFYMFSFAPVYLVTGFEHEIVYQFGSSMGLDRVPKVVSYRAPVPLFEGLGDNWSFYLQGLPRKLGNLFKKFVMNMVIVDREAKDANGNPNQQYWRVNAETHRVLTPTVVSAPAEIDVFVPTGMDYRYMSQMDTTGRVTFVECPPQIEVINAGRAHFLGDLGANVS